MLELAQFSTHLLLRNSACDFSDMVRSSSSMVQSCFGLDILHGSCRGTCISLNGQGDEASSKAYK